MKRMRIDLESSFEELEHSQLEMKHIKAEGLDMTYTILLRRPLADELMQQLQQRIEYYEGELTKVRVFGKWHEIPRQQVAYGDKGMKYTFSGITLPAKDWIPPLELIRNLLKKITGFTYNFVLINRYRNGQDHIGEHRDGESDLDKNVPIASISLGQQRQFVLKHGDARKPAPYKRDIPRIKLNLDHGSLLMMNPPTNEFWYHSLPPRKKATRERINMTFRKIIT